MIQSGTCVFAILNEYGGSFNQVNYNENYFGKDNCYRRQNGICTQCSYNYYLSNGKCVFIGTNTITPSIVGNKCKKFND